VEDEGGSPIAAVAAKRPATLLDGGKQWYSNSLTDAAGFARKPAAGAAAVGKRVATRYCGAPHPCDPRAETL
jgi:hypothetical protein